MNKKFCYIFTLLVTVLFFVDFVSAKSRPDAISVDAGLNGNNLSYINSVSFRIKKSSSGDYVYCLNRHKNTYSVENFFVSRKLDAGFKYLIENGFPNTSITGDNNKDYYITQMAIWLYQDETGQYSEYAGHKNNIGIDFIINSNNTKDDPNQLIRKITALMEGAINARNSSTSTRSCTDNVIKVNDNNIKLTKKDNYYISLPISVETSSSYTVEFTNLIKGSHITDENGKDKSIFNSNEKFIIKIPADVMIKDESVIIKSNCSNAGAVYEYVSKVSDHQNILPAVIYDSEVLSSTTSVEIKFAIDSNSSTDDNNDKDQDNDKDDNNHYIGDLDCSKECVDGSKDCNKNCLNNNTNVGNNNDSNDSNNSVFIPNTDFDFPIIIIMCGTLLILFGLGFVYFNVKKGN